MSSRLTKANDKLSEIIKSLSHPIRKDDDLNQSIYEIVSELDDFRFELYDLTCKTRHK